MREIGCKRGRDTERQRQIKRERERGGGIRSEGEKMEGRDVIDGYREGKIQTRKRWSGSHSPNLLLDGY